MLITQRVRGLLGMATLWGVSVAVVGTSVLVGGLVAGVIPGGIFTPRMVIAVAVRQFVSGAFAGLIFGALMSTVERRKTVATLSLRRVAAYGFVGFGTPAAIVGISSAALLPSPFRLIAFATVVSGLFGAALSTTMVAIARRAPDVALAGIAEEPILPPPG